MHCILHGKLRAFEFWKLPMNDNGYKAWMCIICGWIYDEGKGAPQEFAEAVRWYRLDGGGG